MKKLILVLTCLVLVCSLAFAGKDVTTAFDPLATTAANAPASFKDAENMKIGLPVTSIGNRSLDDCDTPFPEGWETDSSTACWAVVNVNQDAYTWGITNGYAHSGSRSAYIRWNSMQAHDDWLISPGVSLVGGTAYQLKYWLTSSTYYLERLGVYYGTTQDVVGMTNVLEAEFEFDHGYVQKIYTFTPAADGIYYIGWHAASDADMYYIAMDDIELGLAPTAPGKCCYGDPCFPTCEMLLEAACAALGGTFDPAGNCEGTNPCPVPQAGELCCNAFPLTVPSTVTGSTVGFANDYEYACNYSSTSPDVVYVYEPAVNQQVTFDLCGSLYDTKIFIYQNACMNPPMACNDDFGGTCGGDGYKSRLECVNLLAGNTYFIVIDGYGGYSGTYTLVTTVCEACNILCPEGGIAENEVCPNFPDNYNAGCNSTPSSFFDIFCEQTICGTSVGNGTQRDTDWYRLTIATPMVVTLTGTSEFPAVMGFVPYLTGWEGSGDCGHIGTSLNPYVLVPRCETAFVSSACLIPGVYFVFFAPQSYAAMECSDYFFTVTCAPCELPQGRCCYGPEPASPLCAVNAEYQCRALGGTWSVGATCADPCPIPFICHCTDPAEGRHCNMTGGPLADQATVTYTVDVPMEYHITDLNVCLDILHTYDSDLVITLTSPQGTSVILSDQAGESGDNFHCTTFDDEAMEAIGIGLPPFEGSFIPSEALAGFDGENAMGTWTLTIQDLWAGDTGSLTWFCLDFTWDMILSVNLASLTALPGNGEATLNWTTASERDNSHFDIVRNGNVVARVNGAGTSSAEHHYSWTEENLTNGNTYSYTLYSVDINNVRTELGTVEVMPSMSASVVTEYALRQNFPNPFNPTTSISFDLVENGNVTLTVYNPMGQLVATVLSGPMNAGAHSITFDASNLPSGMYLYRIDVNGFSAAKKMLLMK